MKKIVLLIIITTNFTFQFGSAQNTTAVQQLSLDSSSLDNQFEFIIKKSSRYLDYKVVKRAWIDALRQHTLDSIKAAKKIINKAQAEISTQQNEINSLKSNLSAVKTDLDKAITEKNSLHLFGLKMSKTTYNILLWGLIFLLLALAAMFYYQFVNSNRITKASQLKLKEIEAEYEEHRRIAIEREQKVRRHLQDEINKNKTK